MTISSELPSESFDEYLHFGPPVFVFQEKNNHAIQELITLLQKKQDLFQHLLLYNINLPIVHKIVKQIHHHIINQPTNDNSNIHKGTNEKQKEPLQISIIYTNQQDFQFTKKQHEINRNLRLSNIISTFASTTMVSTILGL